jgi:heme exporter protein A
VVRWQGEPLSLRRAALATELIYLGHLNGVSGDLSALENLQMAAALGGRAVTHSAAKAALEAVGLAAVSACPARLLSQGQRRRIALARLYLYAPATAPQLWILDEPFVALDGQGVAALTARLNLHLAAQGSLVLTTHQAVTLQAPINLNIALGHDLPMSADLAC